MNLRTETAPGGNGVAGEPIIRPTFRLSDLWRAPLHDLPIRDEILYQYLPLGRETSVLEVGPGSGFTAYRLARQVKRVVSLDVAERNIARLQNALSRVANLRFVCGDICGPEVIRLTGGAFDAVFALDVLQYVPHPDRLFLALAETLRSGGSLLVQWPNYPAARTGGTSYVTTRKALDGMLGDAGFTAWEVYVLKLRRFPALWFDTLHELPLRLLRSLRNPTGDERPQVYDQTWALNRQQRWETLQVPLNLAWTVLMAAMRMGGPCFERIPLHGETIDGNLMVLAKR